MQDRNPMKPLLNQITTKRSKIKILVELSLKRRKSKLEKGKLGNNKIRIDFFEN